jgi:two-component system, OmpR family, sensor histidine kinase SenX3
MTLRRAFGGTTWLAVAVAILLPALAWMQYDWVTQLASVDRERRERTLRTAASQFTAAVDTELSRLGGSLQLDGAMVEREDWDAYALRYAAATANQSASLVRGVWYVQAIEDAPSDDQRLVLRQWMPEQRTFDVVAWPAELATVRSQMEQQVSRRPRDGDDPRDLMGSPWALGDERTLVMPIVRVTLPRGGRDAGRGRIVTDLGMRGYTIVSLAIDEIASERLPALVGEHFPASAEFRVAVVGKDDGRVIFESEPGAAAATAEAPDLTTPFLHPRIGPMMIFARAAADGRRIDTRVEALPPPPPPPPPAPASSDAAASASPGAVVSVIEMRDRDGDRTIRTRRLQHPEGHWTLRVKHAAGSLEAAVEGARRRNLLLSGSVLALLGVAVGLIAVSARRAQALARQQMEFVAAVSHELRTPVAVINSAAGNLADGVVGEPGRVKQYGQTIQGEARRLGETVERVLQLAGLGSGRPVPMGPVAASDVVREAVQRSAADAHRAGVAIEVEVAPGVPDVLGDAGALQSAVQNLVGNAVKYAGADRWVRVAVDATSSPRREVRIAVEDHGAGLAADEQRLVFEPFYRGRDAVANQIHGSGLGLSLVRKIAEAHGGRVELESEPGRGSTFTISVPAAPDAPGPTAQTAASGASRTPAPSAG